ncbi:hypothetical protein OHA71_06630 [Streptomyces sp. NBC_00444]|uniref:hypothetical protein n=1 Tax=Streptomyces sp. NBC_00444 TaxID=2975744 RepID=UPI002E21E56D
MTTQQDAPAERADIAVFLASHLKGRTVEELSTEFHDLLEAVRAHGKKGQLVVTFVVEPPANGVEYAPLPIGIESTVKAPKATPPKDLYFLDGEGNPSKDDPRQLSIEFRTAPTTTDYKKA